MNKLDYFIECLSESFLENNVSANLEQIKNIAKDIELAQQNMGQAFYVPENPLINEVKELKKQLKIEQSKVVCETCKGNGRLYFSGPYHGSNTEYHICRGEGYVVL